MASKPRRVTGAARKPTASPATPEHPAAILIVAIVAAIAVVISVSNRIFDPDIWQHLAVGNAIWTLRAIPMSHLWTWPGYGEPYVLPSWFFRALLWPFWSIGGVEGLFVWRWVTTLAAFAILWAIARRMGARGLSTLVVMVLCALVYHKRSQVRPETLIAVLFAAQIWLLETLRHGGADRTRWLLAVALIWANAHISYALGFVVLGIYWADAWFSARAGNRERRDAAGHTARRLALIGLGALAVSFVNPFGWRTLWQPFEFFFSQRQEPLFKSINELQPLYWIEYVLCGLPLLIVGWPALLLWRMRRTGVDRVELVMCAFFTALGISTQRFIGFYALAAAPFVARDLEEWIASRRWRLTLDAPKRAAIAAALCVGICLPEWSNPIHRLGLGFENDQYPIRACDFMAEHGVRGRGFNQFHLGGYQLYRFWPERERLPFMDIHQSGTAEDRYLYVRALLDRAGWDRLDGKYHFDYALLSRAVPAQQLLLDTLDSDSTWTLVFLDDPAALYVRRGTGLDPVTQRFGYHWIPAGLARLEELRIRVLTSPPSYAGIIEELGREAAGSPYNSDAHSLLASIALVKGQFGEARNQLAQVLRVNPRAPRAHERLGLIALEENRPDEARREFLVEKHISGPSVTLEFDLATVAQRAGNLGEARAAYRRALRLDPTNEAARDSLDGLEGAATR